MNKKLVNIATIAVFSALLFGFSIADLFNPIRSFSATENRYLAQFPAFSWNDLVSGKFTSEYEKFVTDQFIGRDFWVSLKVRSELALGKKDINGVFFARDGYLMERLSSVDEDRFNKNLSYLKRFVDRMNTSGNVDSVKVMIVPSAAQILSEKLPAFAPTLNQDKIIDDIYAQLPAENITDVRDILYENRDRYIYYKTDHHWTTTGAYLAYRQWALDSGFTPYEESDFDISVLSNSFLGTLHSKVNIDMEPDTMYSYTFKGGEYTLNYNLGEKIESSLYNYAALDTKDKHSAYIGGNNAILEIDTNAGTGKNLLVIKDSFAHSFVPFAAAHYDKIVVVDFRYLTMSMDKVVEEHSIDDVLVLYNTVNFTTDTNMAVFAY